MPVDQARVVGHAVPVEGTERREGDLRVRRKLDEEVDELPGRARLWSTTLHTRSRTSSVAGSKACRSSLTRSDAAVVTI